MAWSNCNIVKLSAKYNNKTVQIEALVSEDIKEDKVLLSWRDCEKIGAISITRFSTNDSVKEKIKSIKKKYGKILKMN